MVFETSLILVILGIFGGVIAGFGGPGGLPVILGIFALTETTPGVQAGTTSTIFVFASLFVSIMYAYSGNIRKDIVVFLVPPTLVGTPLGVYANQFLSRELFGTLIGVTAMIIGLNLIYRETRNLEPLLNLDMKENRARTIVSAIGLLVGIIGGMTGIGGPALSIPLLIVLGFPVLESIAAGLVQGFFVTSSSAINYYSSGQISPQLVLLIGIPYVFSQILGWYYAHKVDAGKLKVAISILLVGSGLYLII